MLKNLSLIALLGFAVVGVPSELSAKSVKAVSYTHLTLPTRYSV